MSTSFPNAVDTFPTAADLADDTLATKPHSTLHGNLGDAVIAVEQNALVIAPATSARNVIQSSADATELTLKAFAGQTAPKFLITDENDNQRFLLHQDMEMLLGDGNNGITSYGTPTDVPGGPGTHRTTEQLVTATNDNGKFIEAGLTARANDDDTGTGYVGLQGTVAGVGGHGQAFFEITATNAVTRVRAVVGQTTPLAEWADENLDIAARVMPNGTVISNAHAAPADADLNNSDFALWLTDTPGAVVLHGKMKDSTGALYTFAIPATAV